MTQHTPSGHTNAITASRVIGTAVYNTAGEVDTLVEALHDARRVFEL